MNGSLLTCYIFHKPLNEIFTSCIVIPFIQWQPGTGKPSGLTTMGLHRVGHDWSDLAAAATAMPFWDSKVLAQRYFALLHHPKSGTLLSKVDHFSIFIVCQKVIRFLFFFFFHFLTLFSIMLNFLKYKCKNWNIYGNECFAIKILCAVFKNKWWP